MSLYRQRQLFNRTFEFLSIPTLCDCCDGRGGEGMYNGRKKYIQSLPKSKRLEPLISCVLDELEKRRFWHLAQNRQAFFSATI
jgi:hypothetical protein